MKNKKDFAQLQQQIQHYVNKKARTDIRAFLLKRPKGLA
jgi:hypothetical protein